MTSRPQTREVTNVSPVASIAFAESVTFTTGIDYSDFRDFNNAYNQALREIAPLVWATAESLGDYVTETPMETSRLSTCQVIQTRTVRVELAMVTKIAAELTPNNERVLDILLDMIGTHLANTLKAWECDRMRTSFPRRLRR